MSTETWPTTDKEREAFKEWQYEVSNGDTVLGFRGWLTKEETTPTPEPLHFTVVPTEDDVALDCPDPECKGSVVEVDEAIRWNPLVHHVDGSGEHWLWTHTSGDSSWEGREPDRFICDTCLRPVVFDGDAVGLIEFINYD